MIAQDDRQHVELDSPFNIDIFAVPDAESFRTEGRRFYFAYGVE